MASNDTDSKKHTLSIKTSGDFENDPEGAIDALDKTGFALFMISKHWFSDERAIKEWRFARDANKPMIYIFRDVKEIIKEPQLYNLMIAPTLIGTINDYGDTKQTGIYIQAMIASYCKVNDIEL
jgi:hypothetical protein